MPLTAILKQYGRLQAPPPEHRCGTILDSLTPSSAFTTLISMKQGEKTQKIVAKYVYDRFRERDRRVKYNLV